MSSKFKGLLDAVKGREPEPEPEQPSQEPKTQLSEAQQSLELQPETVAEPQSEAKRGRPKGKRSDSNYEQVTAYIRKDTHTAVKIELLKESQNGQKREFSELIQELLDEWLKSRS
ncbi:hypothetical protein NIES37_72710 (plasmid) [Tolypothrix tenuis PCC 7101]|uniref:Uncharacterized protein n=1 Tax=Tolypothrix tenuis PCC 7101 TaxID=231146 RepID=A0A1Z4NC05_9CYAN|nr:hypothetical protein [Aulosira sp. FACHB-113]BAZ03258.1 hypothetical protein NIES37_72710 [Tolypothrix tenuis PCC 7101]BAZ78652.1 hypothetical protein NIES50_72850 [Aulosira laxa NIES-50]